jgi:hypothetical protein
MKQYFVKEDNFDSYGVFETWLHGDHYCVISGLTWKAAKRECDRLNSKG